MHDAQAKQIVDDMRLDDGSWGHGLTKPEWFRVVVGGVALLFPLVLLIWGLFLGDHRILATLSDYYALRTRDAFVGMLFIIGLALIGYRGYDNRDHWATNIAGALAVLIAVFPVTGGTWEKYAHLGSAAVFFVTLAYISLYLFTKMASTHAMTDEKKVRNRIYVGCGYVIVACVLAIPVYQFSALSQTALQNLMPVFWLESFAVWAFGFAWLVKAELHPLLFADPTPSRTLMLT